MNSDLAAVFTHHAIWGGIKLTYSLSTGSRDQEWEKRISH